MNKLRTVTNGIFKIGDQYYMMCGDENVPINIVMSHGTRLAAVSTKSTSRVPRVLKRERRRVQ